MTVVVARYSSNDVDHKLYTFQSKSNGWGRYIKIIPEDQRVNYKYCKTCNICYKKSYYKNHKRTQFHTKKQKINEDLHNKKKGERKLAQRINRQLKKQLKNNDIQIGNIICEYLKDSCCDCNEDTVNPTSICQNGNEINICQHCYGKYTSCCGDGCNWIGTEKHFNFCNDCKQFGCREHIKKNKCIDCAHGKIDNNFGKTNYQDNIIKISELQTQVKRQKEIMSHRARILVKKSNESKKLKIDYIVKTSKIQQINTKINTMVQNEKDMKIMYEKEIQKLKDQHERELLEQKALFFDKMMMKMFE